MRQTVRISAAGGRRKEKTNSNNKNHICDIMKKGLNYVTCNHIGHGLQGTGGNKSPISSCLTPPSTPWSGTCGYPSPRSPLLPLRPDPPTLCAQPRHLPAALVPALRFTHSAPQSGSCSLPLRSRLFVTGGGNSPRRCHILRTESGGRGVSMKQRLRGRVQRTGFAEAPDALDGAWRDSG